MTCSGRSVAMPELHDRDRARVAGEDRLRIGDHLVEGAEHVDLHRLVLDDRLDDQLAVGQLVEVGREPQPTDGGVALLLGQLAGARRPARATSQIRAWPASAAAASTSLTITSRPARARPSAIPAPISPLTDHADPFDVARVIARAERTGGLDAR